MKNNADCSSKYLEKETEYLRAIYTDLRKETRALEAYTLLAVGAIWSWCVTNQPNSSHVKFLIWLPFIFAVLFGIRAFGIFMQMLVIREYLRKIETMHTGLPEELGWEQFLNTQQRRFIWPITSFVFWIILILLTIFVPLLLGL